MLKKDAAGKWVGSNPDAALEYSAEVNMSHSDRIDIAVKCGEDEMYRTVATRKEGPLFVDVDLTRTYVNNHVTTVLISGSEKTLCRSRIASALILRFAPTVQPHCVKM